MFELKKNMVMAQADGSLALVGHGSDVARTIRPSELASMEIQVEAFRDFGVPTIVPCLLAIAYQYFQEHHLFTSINPLVYFVPTLALGLLGLILFLGFAGRVKPIVLQTRHGERIKARLVIAEEDRQQVELINTMANAPKHEQDSIDFMPLRPMNRKERVLARFGFAVESIRGLVAAFQIAFLIPLTIPALAMVFHPMGINTGVIVQFSMMAIFIFFVALYQGGYRRAKIAVRDINRLAWIVRPAQAGDAH